MVKCILFIKILLLVIISGRVINDLNAINKCMLVKKSIKKGYVREKSNFFTKKSNKYCIDITKDSNNLRYFF